MQNALKLLETRRRVARPKGPPVTNGLPNDIPNPNEAPTVRGLPSLLGMRQWLQLLGHSDSDINKLNVIHIAGTKGKGSTCAFARSLLQAHGSRTGFPRKVGLYTSPDLRSVRERIQIDNKPIMEDLFAKYFFEIWDRLPFSTPQVTNEDERAPRFLQLLALLAFHTFIREGTDATIFETHHGGEYDATNVIQQPVVTGITSIGMDHVAQLGPAIENVAWHKSGIFKAEVPAFSAPQEPAVEAVLKNRAAQKGAPLKFIHVDNSLPRSTVLQVPVQQLNCSLALALVGAFLKRSAARDTCELNSSDISTGVENFLWPGRFEIIVEGRSKWFLDGAHNELSIAQAASWFSKNTQSAETSKHFGQPRAARILIFAHFSNERDGVALLRTLAAALVDSGARPDYVIFTTFKERQDGVARIKNPFSATMVSNTLAEYSDLWRHVDPNANVVSKSSIEEALEYARQIGERHAGMETLVTGSLYLVGGTLSLLRPLS